MSTLSPPDVLVGAQRPRVASLPPALSSAGQEAAELAESAGLVLDPWQRYVLDGMLGERRDGKWAAFECGLLVPRQNGKNAIVEARELFALFLDPDCRLVIHSAHQFDTSLEAFGRLKDLIEATPDLDREVASLTDAHGQEGIRLRNRSRIRYRTRTKSGGRGFTGDLLVLDEAQKLARRMFGTLLPTLSARPNAQVVYLGTVPEPEDPDGEHFRTVRDRGRAGTDPELAWWEWNPAESMDGVDLEDPAAQAAANPALGYRITPESIAREVRAQPDAEGRAEVARERFCIWPPGSVLAWQVFSESRWSDIGDEGHEPQPGTFGLHMPPNRSFAVIGSAAGRPDGRVQVLIADQRPGSAWAVPRLVELTAKSRRPVVIDARGAAAALITDLERAGVPVVVTNATDMARACGGFFDDAQSDKDRLRHWRQPALDAAVKAVVKRELSGSFAWDGPAVEIAPLYAVTLARYGHVTAPPAGSVGFLTLSDILGGDDDGASSAG